MIRVMIACAALSVVLSGCSDSLANGSGQELSKQAQCEAIIAYENAGSGRLLNSQKLVDSLVNKDLVNACQQTASPIVAHLHLRYGL